MHIFFFVVLSTLLKMHGIFCCFLVTFSIELKAFSSVNMTHYSLLCGGIFIHMHKNKGILKFGKKARLSSASEVFIYICKKFSFENEECRKKYFNVYICNKNLYFSIPFFKSVIFSYIYRMQFNFVYFIL